MLRRLVILLVSAVIAVISTFWLLAAQSQSGQAPGLVDNKLAPCPTSPNCVNSEFPIDNSHFITPLTLSIGQTEAMIKVNEVISQQGGDITVSEDNYLAATFRSDLFGFIDDLEIRIDPEQKQVHLRSAARVGHSDLGVNKERAHHLGQLLTKQLNP